MSINTTDNSVTIETALPAGTNTIGAVSLVTGGNASTDVNPLPVQMSDTQSDIHGQLIGVTRITQVATKFFQQAPDNFLNITTTGSGSTSSGTGVGIFSTGASTNGRSSGVTPVAIQYSAQYEAFASMATTFTAPIANSYQRLGVYNTVDGFAFGYDGLTFGVWTRYNSVDTFIPQASWNKDVLSGGATSGFTSGRTPVALIQTNMNMYRMRYGWYGASTTRFEVYCPDGKWVLVHQVRTANSQVAVNLTNPNLPMTIDVSKTAATTTDLIMTCGGWSAGVTAPTTGPTLSGRERITALNGAVQLPLAGLASVSFSITGTWNGTLSFQYSLDGLAWTADAAHANVAGNFVTSTTVNNAFSANVSSYRYYRIVATSWTSGTATVIYHGSQTSSVITAQSLITDGANNGPVTVKPASTLPLATDVALVVTTRDPPVSATGVLHSLVTVTTAGTRVQFATNTVRNITIKATVANSGIIYVGNSGVTSANGYPLAAGDTLSLDISNTNALYVDASVSGNTCTWIANL